jgi:S1-C subfamily serine protease
VRWLLVVALVGCGGGSARPEFPTPEDAEAAPARRAAGARGPGVTRAELDHTLAAGPGAFLARVHVRAARDASGFRGWELVALDPPFDKSDLAAGDVVLRVNGRVVERPEELQAAWDALRSADAITVEYLRGGARRQLRVPVVDSGPRQGGDEETR